MITFTLFLLYRVEQYYSLLQLSKFIFSFETGLTALTVFKLIVHGQTKFILVHKQE